MENSGEKNFRNVVSIVCGFFSCFFLVSPGRGYLVWLLFSGSVLVYFFFFNCQSQLSGSKEKVVLMILDPLWNPLRGGWKY